MLASVKNIYKDCTGVPVPQLPGLNLTKVPKKSGTPQADN
jgi:hypothetical protein